MADAKEVKTFKEYLIETNTFQKLTEIISLLHKSEPKPENPILFLHDKLARSAMMDEIHGMKQILSQLGEDVSQMKADITKIANAISKLLPEHLSIVDSKGPGNDSAQSMENNAGHESHISELDDSSMLFDETMNNSVEDNHKNLQSAMKSGRNGSAADDSNEHQNEHTIDPSLPGFTLEYVEVDVVQNKSLQDEFMSTSPNKIAAEAMQIDEMVLNSTVEGGVIANTLNAQFLVSETVPSELHKKMPLEELPIVMKEEDSEEQLELSQSFCGFDSIDVQASEQLLFEVKADRSNTKSEKEPATFDTLEIESLELNESKNSQTSVIQDNTDNISIDLDAENQPVDVEIIDDEQHQMSDAAENVTNNGEKLSVPTECASVPKDDPETKLFLSFS